MITAASFPTPDLALRSNDPVEQQRVHGFAHKQAAAAEELRHHLADLPSMPFDLRVDQLRSAMAHLALWRYQLALNAPGRLGAGIAPDVDHFLMDHRQGGVSYDRLGYTGRMRAGSAWDPTTRTFQGGEETPASAIIERYGQLARARFQTGANILHNVVHLPDGRQFTGNRFVRGTEAARVAEMLKNRVSGRGRDTSTFETGGDPVYVVTAHPTAADVLHGIALLHLAGAFDLDVIRDERITAWQESRYLLYQGRQTKKGSDAVIRVFLVAVGAVLFGQPPVMEQDCDLRCMVLGQKAATEMPADEVLWTAKDVEQMRGGA